MENDAVFVSLKLLAVLVLVLANGFFVAAEFLLVSVRRSRVDQLVAEGRTGAVRLRRPSTGRGARGGMRIMSPLDALRAQSLPIYARDMRPNL